MNNFKHIITYFYMFPAILIGTLAMISYGVPSSFWIQNILIWFFGSILGLVFLMRKKQQIWSYGNWLQAIGIIFILILPFWFDDLDGVHRWLTFGPINVYIASIILPLFIILLWNLTLNTRIRYVIGVIFISLLILLFHPDAGQLTAFACATSIILWKKINNKMIKLLSIALTATFVIISWTFLDDLAPVPYVEDIILLVADMGNVWFILGVLSLILLLIPFFYHDKKSIVSFSLGIYFLMTMLVTLFGNFPLPIMGYGISPVIGYLIAITWLNRINE